MSRAPQLAVPGGKKLVAPRPVRGARANADSRSPSHGSRSNDSIGAHAMGRDEDKEEETEEEQLARAQAASEEEAARDGEPPGRDDEQEFADGGGNDAATMLAELREQMRAMRAEQLNQGKMLRVLESERDEANSRAEAAEERAGVAEEARSVAESKFSGNGGTRAIITRTVQAPKTILQYSQASTASKLEDWFHSMALYFNQQELHPSEHAARLQQVPLYLDRALSTWWEQQLEDHEARGSPIKTWTEFAELMRAHFLPARESEMAVGELYGAAMEQRAGESMDVYFHRATEVIMRVGRKRLPEERVMVEMTMHRLRKEEWPHTFAQLKELVDGGSVATFARLRAEAQTRALREPGKQAKRAGAGPSSAPKPAKAAPNKLKQKLRAAVASIAARLEAMDTDGTESDGSDEDGHVHVAPASVRDTARDTSGACVRCKQPGHHARDCKGKEQRACFYCKETGHLKPDCPKRKAKAKPKNE